MPIPAGNLNVYLTNLGKAYGATPPGGGHVVLTSLWHRNGVYPPHLDAQIRGNAAHELIHIAQWQHFGSKMLPGRWWMEMSAAYLADLFWQRQGKPCNLLASDIMQDDTGKMLTVPINDEDAENNYSYASFLKWLESKGDTYCAVDAVNRGGDAALENFAAAIQAQFQKPLADLFEEFALDYYHNDLWQAKIVPPGGFDNSMQTAAQKQCCGPANFAFLTRTGLSQWQATVEPYAKMTSPPMKPLTAWAFPVRVEAMSEYQKSKLVVEGQGPFGDNLRVWLGSGRTGPTYPGKGKNNGISLAPLQNKADKPPLLAVIDDFMPDTTDRVTVVVVNKALSKHVWSSNPSVTMRRWALLRPEWVSAGRATPGSQDWKVEWDPTPLYKHNEDEVLERWQFFCRKRGDADFPANPIEERTYANERGKAPPLRTQITVPDANDSVFTAREVDRYGNQGYPAIVEGDDMFQGTWSGTFRLVEGLDAQVLKNALAKYLQKMDQEEQATIAKITDPQEKARHQKGWDEQKKFIKELQQTVDQFITIGVLALRSGIPMEFQIRRTEDKYFFGVMKIGPFATGAKPDIPLERLARHTLGFEELKKAGGPPLLIRLHRPDEIRDEYTFEDTVQVEENGKKRSEKKRFVFKWQFYRQKK